MLSYFLVGGVASISLITILNRYRQKGDEAGADDALLIVLNGVAAVLGAAILCLRRSSLPLTRASPFTTFRPRVPPSAPT